MPFVSIRILEGHGKERMEQIASKVTDVITEVCELPREFVWVVFEEIPATRWYVAGNAAKPVQRGKP